MLNMLERKFGRFAIANLSLYIIVIHGFFYLAGAMNPDIIQRMVLDPQEVLNGEWWRLITFMMMPPVMPRPTVFSVIFIFFALYLFWLMGSALEQEWGAFRYNMYLLIAYLATVVSVWVVPDSVATNAFILSTVLLAFAVLYPDFTIMLFLVLPVKVKWIALLTWFILSGVFLMGTWGTRVLIIAAVLNYFLFFGKLMWQRTRQGIRRMRQRKEAAAAAVTPFHECKICGRSDKSDPQLEFRYCPECTGVPCYCEDHIHDHEHS